MEALARKLLHLIVLKHVDDFFGPEWEQTVQGAKKLFARHVCLARVMFSQLPFSPFLCRLVRVLLGPTAIAEKKLEAGNGLVILGVHVLTDECGISAWPSQDKVEKWVERIGVALKDGKMSGGTACGA